MKTITREDVDKIAAQYAGEELAKLAAACNDISLAVDSKRLDALLATAVCVARDQHGASLQGFVSELVPFVIFIWESMDSSEGKSVGDA